nr:2-hydroxyacyl-CoA dehydratase family protein [Spirochaetota bacterium]
RPDLLISDTNNCSLLVKWFDVYHREYRAPHFILDVPFCYEDQKEPDLNYIVDQYHDLIKTIETMTGQTCDYEKVRRAVQNTAIALKEWKRFARAALSVPSGITAFDTFVHMASYITLRGTEELVEQYRLLADDTEELVARGAFPVKEERYRLLWDNIAPWHQLRKMSARLAGLKANIVAATYTSCMGTLEGGVDLYEYDGGDPLRYLARIQNSSVCPYGLNLRYRVMEELIRRYSIDGVVFASNRSCKVYSVMQLDLSRMVRERLGVPVVMVDVDHADVTRYSEEAVFSRIEALLEQIDVKKNSL